MANKISTLYSPLTGKIYAGRIKQVRGADKGVRQFSGDKFDVTTDAIRCVADKIISNNEPITIQLLDGKTLTVYAEITSP